jgi:hypothetical protein
MITLAHKNKEKQFEAISRMWLGRILRRRDTSQSNKAEKEILQGIKACEEEELKPFLAQGHLFLGEVHKNVGQREKGLENLKKAEGMFQDMGMHYWLEKTQDLLNRL